MVNRYKVPKVACKLMFPYGMVNTDTVLMIDEIQYGSRRFQINGVLIDVI